MQIDTYIHQHPYACIAALWAFTNMVLYMPPPDPKGSKFYQWFFGVMHALAGAIPRIASNFFPANSVVGKVFAGGNGLSNGSTSTLPASEQAAKKVDAAPPKA